MAPADGQDTETYYLTVTARVSGQTIRYNFILTASTCNYNSLCTRNRLQRKISSVMQTSA